jgi:hypothetical protein
MYPEDAYSLAVVKLGSGSNLLGYYMYHGGTNPEGENYLNESQRSPATNYNDMPVKNYDFQAPLGEFGQTYPHYYTLRKLHLFMQDFGELLAPMEAQFPCQQDIAKGDDSFLRYAIREKEGSGFVFINNYERLQSLTTKKNVCIEACGVRFPRLTIPAGTVCIFPVRVEGIRYATAQIIAQRDGKLYLEQIPGIPTTLCMEDGKVLRHVKPRSMDVPVYKNIYLLDSYTAGRLFLDEASKPAPIVDIPFTKVCEASADYSISIGVNKVAEAPRDEHFESAAVYTIALPECVRDGRLLHIDYRGDVARLYCNGQLIADNFYNGRPMLYGLWRLPADCKQLELRIIPQQNDMPVYFPREAEVKVGEEVKSISIE